MPIRITHICALLAVVALLMVPVPVGAVDSVVGYPADDTCCADESGCESTGESNDTDEPVEEDCCPSGCHSCFLQCCNGLVALNAFSVALGSDESSHRARAKNNEQFSPAHPRAVYHPPRR